MAAPDTQIAAMILPDAGADLRALVERLEKRLIEQALDRHDGVIAHAARAGPAANDAHRKTAPLWNQPRLNRTATVRCSRIDEPALCRVKK